MKRHGNLFEYLISFSNLHAAAKKARQGCGRNSESCRFVFRLEPEIFALKKALAEGTYRPGKYRYFTIYDPKVRRIVVAPFRDRVVHHAIVRVLAPIYENCFIFDSYATRPGKGTHAALQRTQQFLRRNRWFLKADIHKFFDSVPHDLLLSIVARKIKDQRFFNVLEKVVRNTDPPGFGLPIGNLTSQFLANVHLNPFDHFIKEEAGVKCYLRYMDDFVLFADHRKKVLDMRTPIQDFLQQRLGLALKQRGTWVNRSVHGLSFLGHCIYPGVIRVRGKNLRRSLKRIRAKQKAWTGGFVTENHAADSMASSIGHLRKFNPGLRMK